MTLIYSLSAVYIFSAIAHILSDSRIRKDLCYIFKPLTITIAILIVAMNSYPTFSQYSLFIIAGLIASLVGDCFLMLRTDNFVKGLLSFLIAHVLYIRAFTLSGGFLVHLPYLLASLLLAMLVLRVLLPRAGSYRIPIIIYSVVLLVMFWQALEHYLLDLSLLSSFSFFGAALFFVSDSSLAHDRFVRKRKAKQTFVLSTYYLAQLLISYSSFAEWA
jgi:uncharacterized membrane protein YhhN